MKAIYSVITKLKWQKKSIYKYENFLFSFEGRNFIKTALEIRLLEMIKTIAIIEEMASGHPIGLVLQKTSFLSKRQR